MRDYNNLQQSNICVQIIFQCLLTPWMSWCLQNVWTIKYFNIHKATIQNANGKRREKSKKEGNDALRAITCWQPLWTNTAVLQTCTLWSVLELGQFPSFSEWVNHCFIFSIVRKEPLLTPWSWRKREKGLLPVARLQLSISMTVRETPP